MTIAGFHGHLLSEFFLEGALTELEPDPSVFSALRKCVSGTASRWPSFGPAASIRTLLDSGAEPLLDSLGFKAIRPVDSTGEAALAVASAGAIPIAVVVSRWGDRLDRLWRVGVLHAKRQQAHYCLLYNGLELRLIDARRLYARRAVSFVLADVADDERALHVFASIMGARMFDGDLDGSSAIQRLIEQSERHASGVCQSLRQGVMDASASILGAMWQATKTHERSAAHVDTSFEQALTIVYRLLFLLFAEARGLLPVWHPIYRNSYSIGALRDAVERPAAALGLWDTLRASSRLVHAGCRAGDLRVTPFNGRLFSPAQTPFAERRNLDDEAARQAVLALSTRPAPDGAGRERIEYRDLGVEQLGSVYEALLDFTPRVGEDRTSGTRRRWRVSLEPGSDRRKATGSFYTPRSIAAYLVRRTLAPLVENAAPEQILALRVLDPAMGSGAFLVAACRYLAQAYESALIESDRYHPSDFGAPERVSIRRTIAEQCLFGVDVNPMAVQLARLSLWLATLAADRPLTFLDHHLQTGNSLIGTWLSRLGRVPQKQRRVRWNGTLPLWNEQVLHNALRHAVPIRFSLARVPDDTVEQVREKDRALTALTAADSALSKWKRVGDLWCSTWFAPDGPPANAFRSLSDTILTARNELPDATTRAYLETAAAIAASHRFFHWELEFPEAFFDEHAQPLTAPGFDAVIGNPPWDMIRADAGPDADRLKQRASASAMSRFARESGVYSCCSGGQANRYQLFAERAMALAKDGGRIGLLLPSGFAADHGSAELRRMLFAECNVDGIVGFDNRRGLFPIHRSIRFLLLTGTRGQPSRTIGLRLGEVDMSFVEMTSEVTPFQIQVTPELLSRLTGEAFAVPDLRCSADVAIAERAAAAFPPLGSAQGWGARFGRELNATEDRHAFREPGSGFPVVEGKQIDPFSVRVDQSRWSIPEPEAARLLGRRHQRHRLAYRDVASATNRQTLIAAVLPAGCVSTHTVFCLRTPLSRQAQTFLCGLFNSFVVNYLARLRVTTHVTTAIVEHLPIPLLDHAPRLYREIVALSRLLARQANPRALARLNALVARVYDLTTDEFDHVLSTFPLVPAADRAAAMDAFTKYVCRR